MYRDGHIFLYSVRRVGGVYVYWEGKGLKIFSFSFLSLEYVLGCHGECFKVNCDI